MAVGASALEDEAGGRKRVVLRGVVVELQRRTALRFLNSVIPSEARDLGFCQRRHNRCRKQEPRSLASLGMTTWPACPGMDTGTTNPDMTNPSIQIVSPDYLTS